ncbi:MAG: LD-carboxypeptidase [Alphaproteobacteria bacterium]|nr:LD-carboxypeptidase [Alphaproteobacteria bacterium]
MNKTMEIIAPCFYANLTQRQKKHVETFFAKNNFKVRWGKNVFKKTVQLSGKQFYATDGERLSDLMKAFKTNPDVVMVVRGGGGVARLLPLIDWDVLKKSTSLFVGFSDATVFQNVYYAKTGEPSITGMIAKYVAETPQEAIISSFLNAVNGGDIDFKGLPCYTKGKASGTLIGGNLTSFVNLVGTPYMPVLKGKILLLEEVEEPPYKLDSMLTHLKNAGVFDKVSGVILGDFYQCRNTYDKTDDNAYKVLQNFFKGFKIPVMYGLPYGHAAQHFCLPFGTKTTMDTQKRTIHIDGIKKKR